MVNIDLKTNNDRPAIETSTDFNLIIMLLLTFIVLGAWGGVYLWEKSIDGNIASTNKQINEASIALNRPETKKIIDFQNRLKAAKGFSAEKNKLLASLGEMESKIVAGVYISSFSYNKGEVSMTIIANGFSEVAKQVASLKGSNIFSNVAAGKSSITSEGKVQMTVTMKI